MPNRNYLLASLPEFIAPKMLEAMPIPMFCLNSDLKCIYFNPAFSSYIEFAQAKELKLNDITPKFQPDTSKSIKKLKDIIKIAKGVGSHQCSWTLKSYTGQLLSTQISVVPIIDGDSCYINCFFLQTPAEDKNIQILAQSQENIRILLDTAPIAINLWDQNFRILDTNHECASLFGFASPEDFMKNFRKIIPRFQEDGTSSIKVMNSALSKAFEDGYHRFEFITYYRKDFTPIPVEVTMVRVNIASEDVVVAYLRDMRDANTLIQNMQCAEKRIQTIFDITPLGINVWDVSFNLIECNEAIVRLYGFTNKEEYISSRYKIIPRVQPDGSSSVPIIREMIQKTFDTGYAQLELMTFDMHGNPIPVEVISKRAYVQQQEVVVSFIRDLRDLKAKLSEISAAEKELRSARDLAEQSAMAKTQFLGNMSHELRTPLNGVLGLFHLLNCTKLEFNQQDYVKKGINSANQLLHIVNDILDFSKIDAGTFDMTAAPFTLQEIIHDLQLVYTPQAKDKNITFKCITDDTCKYTLYGDASRIKQVLFHLLSNAVKFTDKGNITLNVSCTEQEHDSVKYMFAVEDSGVGMTKAQSVNIFTPFAQADASITRVHGGCGLGLAIAKRIIKLMHGDIWVKSQKGKGSTFFFTVKIERSLEQSSTLHKVQDAIAKAINIEISKQPPPPARCLGHILLAEDNDVNQIITVELLKNKGYSIDVANNGKEAVKMAKEKEYDMVLMDIQMPVMDGLTATTKIRAIKNLDELPIIAMSAHTSNGDKELCLQYGMNDHIGKPVTPDVLYKFVAKWVHS